MPPKGRGDGRNRSHGHGDPDVAVSKSLSYTLRHGAAKEGLKLREDGYANVAELLAMPKFRRFNLDWESLQRIVRDNSKQRYALASIDPETGVPIPIPLKSSASSTTATTSSTTSTTESTPTMTTSITTETTETSTLTSTETLNPPTLSTDPSDYLIRATQGHSIPLSSSALQLTPITKSNLPPHCIHGTFYAFLDPILTSGGLKPMGRIHIHFAQDLPPGFGSTNKNGSTPVISGMRNDAQLLFYIDLPLALEAGIPFWLSENGVILSEGDGSKRGLLGMDFVEKIVDVGSAKLGVVWERGKGLVKELPKEMRGKGIPRGKERVVKHIDKK